MKIRRMFLFSLLFSPIVFVMQIVLFVFCGYAEKSTKLLLLSPYDPWLRLGLSFDRDSGPGGHAFAGGAILGLLLGVVVYSLVIGTLFGFVCEKLVRRYQPFERLK